MNDQHLAPQHDVDASGSLVSEPHRRRLPNSRKLTVALLVAGFALGVIWLGGRGSKPVEKPRETQAVANTTPFAPAPVVLPPPPPPPEPVAEEPRPAGAPNEISPAETPIFAYTGADGAAQKVEPEMPVVARGSNDDELLASDQEEGSESDLSGRLRSTRTQASRATLLPNPDFVVTQGTIIPCILQTAINTNLAGYVKCVLPQDVRGATGNVILMDRGTTVIGEIQRGLQQGDERVFVLWSRAETPSHAVISLNSPGADGLGRAGLEGEVDNHFWKRFGGTIMLSMIQGVFEAGSSYLGRTENGDSFSSTQSSGPQVAETALRASIDIPPTLSKNQGDTASIFVARDLDFSDVYQLRIKKPPMYRAY
ncbi:MULTISPECIES: type IV secretion system protein VirB10 [Rhizobium]|uniref:type IV secretion system protein VirB10 n=1 Tax=Rhizobium TaxID=379 RepID=UPI001C82BF2C|nr:MULTISPECIES: type IV secretion system protein VirB10 [Rhizobium]MBX4899641.1 type IV secretion system protein VirB10 [Rhizobium bangladeshense]MBX5297559.1 type IV secretion system protein VirB10 [Rhizobium sp. NLR15a]MBY3617819.1 type IV secretion system protein VirB10 [Rhizobium bangladeshense]